MHDGKNIYLRVCYIVAVRLWANDLTSLSQPQFINVRDRDCRSCIFHLRGQFCYSFIHITLTDGALCQARWGHACHGPQRRFCANNHNDVVSALLRVSTGIRRGPNSSWGFHEATWRRRSGVEWSLPEFWRQTVCVWIWLLGLPAVWPQAYYLPNLPCFNLLTNKVGIVILIVPTS